MRHSGRASQPSEPQATDGLADRAAHRPLWKYILVAVGFMLWVAVLAGLHVAARR